MKTIALRFSENFAPDCGTIKAHEELIPIFGHVWYGKLGVRVSKAALKAILMNETPRILLIRSGKPERYWAYIKKAQTEMPPTDEIPEYYRNNSGIFKTWFCVTAFEPATKDILSKCYVASSGRPLGEASRASMSPYFIIEVRD